MSQALQPALISSFDPRGFLAATNTDTSSSVKLFRQIIEHTGVPIAAEIYVLMESDVRASGATVNERDACGYLASLSRDEVATLADRVFACFERHAIKIVSCATFLPEISHGDTRRRARSLAAVTNTLRFADRLSALQDSPKAVVVELVCGSITEPVVYAENLPGKEGSLEVPILHENTVPILLDGLAEAIHCQDLKREPQIALELEPGPLFVLRNDTTLRGLSDAIKKHQDPMVKQCVGLNADLAHWWIAGDIDFESESIKDANGRDYFFDLIKHAHISGHHRSGHFGDFGLQHLDSTAADKMKLWLRCLAASLDKAPGYSGYVSVELEAAFSEEEVINSVKTLISWLGELD